MKNKILIYNDVGVFNIHPLKTALETYFKNNIEIDTISSTEIVNNTKLNNDILALFIPGGIANKYFEKIGIKGNKNIQNYIKNGGIYFGICGGAYYACNKVEFENDIPNSKINAQYKLDLINSCAKGTLYKELDIQPFSHSIDATTIVDIEYINSVIKTNSSALYHGGPFFDLIEKNCQIIANYKLKSGKKLPAILQKTYGKGKVIISGVHFEYNLENLENIISYTNKTNSHSEILKKIKLKEDKRQTLFKQLMQKIR